ncbi:HAD-like domain-containing protein [Gamsiella multidivaricata]|uniref:HAD-like domain-containing protein n=1 Tax=Gamsiella multidivaricata TaxID=101098 RepID=UPI002220CEAB|nr:HAD-like domain-containing protein [Gamsiella multidivaricata]KAG0353345.1 Enolase-phosphatase E1 [Gamsiella multidivaricata]KAI7817467.1 HAD-like domain-containing protein [Gamsiella multidivaricata]
MVLTRSRSNNQASAAPTTPASASKPAAPSKRKSNASASKSSKAAKINAAPDLTTAKETQAPTEDRAPGPAAVAAPIVTPAPLTTPALDFTSLDKASESSQPPAPAAPATATIPAPVEIPVVTAPAPVVASTEEPTVHNSIAVAGVIQPYDVILSDIEGTTTPIVFVKENLFPYVTSNLEVFLKKNWDNEEMKNAVEALRVQAAKDVADGLPGVTAIATESADVLAEKVQQDVIASIGWQMKADRKIGALKAFQGYMWKEGYANGDLKGVIYDDVIPAFDQWITEGKKVYIYSSGSIGAQKLLFGFSEKGDVLHYFSGHYDTTIGPKVEAESYAKIAADIGLDPSKILFLSDNIHEIVAAKKAGFQAVVIDRPGNSPLSAEERANNIVVKSFLEIPKP